MFPPLVADRGGFVAKKMCLVKHLLPLFHDESCWSHHSNYAVELPPSERNRTNSGASGAARAVLGQGAGKPTAVSRAHGLEGAHLHACSSRRIPGEDERANKGAGEDTEEDVSIVVHGQEHDYVRHGKLQRVDAGSNRLLEHGREITGSVQR